MDRLRWCSDEIESMGISQLSGLDEESIVIQQTGVNLYDGPNKSGFRDGILKLTTHRLLWINPETPTGSFIALPLVAVTTVRIEEGGGLVSNRTPKLILRLLNLSALRNHLASLPNPLRWIGRWDMSSNTTTSVYAVVTHSSEDHIKLGFTRSGHHAFHRALIEVLEAKPWTVSFKPSESSKSSITSRYGAGGIAAIERQQAAQASSTDHNIDRAFADLDKLMSHANEMVQLSRNLARRMKDAKSNNLTLDETDQLRSEMLAMGIMDGTDIGGEADRRGRETKMFYVELAHQVCKLIHPLLKATDESSRSGVRLSGCMDLASVYCRVNRARGMDLISPDDLLCACELMHKENLPLRLKCFPGGLMVLQLSSEDEQETLQATVRLVEERSSLTADELARASNLSTLLAKERLLAVENAGLVCRDDSEAGLRFYPNLFLTRS